MAVAAFPSCGARRLNARPWLHAVRASASSPSPSASPLPPPSEIDALADPLRSDSAAAVAPTPRSFFPKRGQTLELVCESLAFKGKGVCKVADTAFVVMCDRALPGERFLGRVSRKKGSYAEVVTKLKTITPHWDAVEAPCQYASYCGGCKTQNLSYEAQVRAKEQQVRDLIVHVGSFSDKDPDFAAIFKPFVPCDLQFHYRNKVLAVIQDMFGFFSCVCVCVNLFLLNHRRPLLYRIFRAEGDSGYRSCSGPGWDFHNSAPDGELCLRIGQSSVTDMGNVADQCSKQVKSADNSNLPTDYGACTCAFRKSLHDFGSGMAQEETTTHTDKLYSDVGSSGPVHFSLVLLRSKYLDATQEVLAEAVSYVLENASAAKMSFSSSCSSVRELPIPVSEELPLSFGQTEPFGSMDSRYSQEAKAQLLTLLQLVRETY
ncbi:hypothetical protein BHM03_00026332 [Ensete ventricosum]|nr:hypothetical protein BHM03_00026332 [Ensete ventricosum]